MDVGLEVLASVDFAPLKGKNIALMTNPSAIDRHFTSTYDHFRHADACRLVALLAPEHGLWATVADGVAIPSTRDPRTGVTIHSLYGDAYRPTREMLADVDVVVCDIQDIGVRYYTFVWTITHILEACGEYGVPALILDRPNPLGDTTAGAMLDMSLASLVGRAPIPVQHGMTLAELIVMFNDLWNPHPASLEVVPCKGLQRHALWYTHQRPFVPPSPNMPHHSTVQQYPGACLIEGTNLSEGRGTTLPFEIVGAPFIDAIDLATALNAHDLPGVHFRPHTMTPTASKFAHQPCQGVQVHITDSRAFDAIHTWLTVIQHIAQTYPEDFAWQAHHETNPGHHFDRLIGRSDVRHQLMQQVTPAQITKDWHNNLHRFRDQRRPYLIYSETICP